MAERRWGLLRQANTRVIKQDRGRDGIDEHHHLNAKLLDGSKSAGTSRNGGMMRISELGNGSSGAG
jgi:hypothetical protein